VIVFAKNSINGSLCHVDDYISSLHTTFIRLGIQACKSSFLIKRRT